MDQKPSEHVEVTPGVCGGRPRIAGHRIRVQDIVEWHERMGFSPDEIVSLYPGLTLSAVYAALAYYHDHQAQVRQDMREDQQLVAEMKRRTPSKLVERLAVRDANRVLS
ncbi:MAG TPA: DUF433 domain-containing protein [Phycisphaerae bacterium]|jgi:uncharacterized protein (DUF433 family)